MLPQKEQQLARSWEFRGVAKTAAAAIERLRDTDWKVETVARQVGWKSKKDLYRALNRFAGLTPAAVRTLPHHEVDAIIARLGDAN